MSVHTNTDEEIKEREIMFGLTIGKNIQEDFDEEAKYLYIHFIHIH